MSTSAPPMRAGAVQSTRFWKSLSSNLIPAYDSKSTSQATRPIRAAGILRDSYAQQPDAIFQVCESGEVSRDSGLSQQGAGDTRELNCSQEPTTQHPIIRAATLNREPRSVRARPEARTVTSRSHLEE